MYKIIPQILLLLTILGDLSACATSSSTSATSSSPAASTSPATSTAITTLSITSPAANSSIQNLPPSTSPAKWHQQLLQQAQAIGIKIRTTSEPPNLTNSNHLAKLDNICAAFKTLANDPNYPLQSLAKLRFLQFCYNKSFSTLTSSVYANTLMNDLRSEFIQTDVTQGAASTDSSKFPDWQKELKLQVLENYFRKWETSPQKNIWLSKLLIEKSKLKSHPKEKLETLRQAIALDPQKNYLLAATFPRFNKQPKSDEYFKVAQDFQKNRQFSEARKYYQRIFSSNKKKFDTDERIQAYKAYRNSFKIEGQKEPYLNAAKKYDLFIQQNGNNKQKIESLLTLGRTYWTQGKNSLAENSFKKILQKFKNQEDLSETYWVLGRFYEDQAQDVTRSNPKKKINSDLKSSSQKALDYYELAHTEWQQRNEILKEPSKEKDILNKINFSKSWYYFKRKNYPMAEKSLLLAIAESTDMSENFKYSYWLAKSIKKQSRLSESKDLFQKIVENDIFGYYGVLAQHELGQPFSKLSTTLTLANFQQDSAVNDPIAVALLQSSETELLKSYLKGKISNPQNLDDYIWLALGTDYLPLFGKLSKLTDPERNFIFKYSLNLIFPEDYLEFVEKYSQKYKVPTELILSIIRQESAFNPMARSPADAFGLMQILGAPNFTHSSLPKLKHSEDLYDVETNIQYGTYLLSQLLKRFHGKCALAAASYNAAESAVQSWVKKNQADDPFEFIENIPYEETRTYVKLVLRNYLFYQRLQNNLDNKQLTLHKSTRNQSENNHEVSQTNKDLLFPLHCLPF